jgi:RNA polymerase sigma-54 factor
VVPDVSVKKLRGQWLVSLNREAMPRLRINRLYADILQRQRGGNAATAPLSSQLQEAKWLIKSVQQRFDTILRVSQAIVDRQRAFLDHGEVAMRPLTLREIAETVKLHESTISRVTTQKYLASPRGIYELKYFFGSHVATDTGGACSSTAIRALIKQLVAAEDGKKPLSDHRISDILAQQGIQVARRTVAKYREALRIAPANLRKAM